MSLLKVSVKQIDTAAIGETVFATVSQVNSVQANVANAGGTVTSDVFNTAANSNTFTLSSAVSDANAVLVTLSGVVQVPIDAYIVSSTTLTLNNTSPLISNLRLEVRYL